MTKTCFVVMGFGKKTDFESGRTLDLDQSYRNMVKPAVIDAGYECLRADEIVHSGLIDVPMYEQLLGADVVVADLSTSNKNAFYELGIRHALRPFTTIVIAEEGLKIPFDVNHIVVRHYKHLGDDIGYSEVMRFRADLTKAIRTIEASDFNQRVDSPVYRFLGGLQQPVRSMAAVAAAPTSSFPAAAQEAAKQTHSELMSQVDKAMDASDFLQAKSLLTAARVLAKLSSPQGSEEPYLVHRLALATYKSKSPDERSALIEAAEILEPLAPGTSNDTETLGLWGAVHKRLWSLTHDIQHLNEAVRALERGFYLRNDYYNGINFAFLLNLRAAQAGDPAEAIADFIQARRVRDEVRRICEDWLKSTPAPTDEKQREIRYWVEATLAEAKIGLAAPDAEQVLQATLSSAPQTWMAHTTRDQVDRLRALLADSPLKHLKP